jgi:hypothetical protein
MIAIRICCDNGSVELSLTRSELDRALPLLEALLRGEVEVGVIESAAGKTYLRGDRVLFFTVADTGAPEVRAAMAERLAERKKFEKELADRVEDATAKGLGFK